MKKIISVFLVILMVLSLMACGGNGVNSKEDTTTEASEKKSGKSSSKKNKKSSKKNKKSSSEEDEEVSTKKDKKKKDKKTSKMDFEEVTVVDNELCTIVITGVDPDDMFGYVVKAHLENKSEDRRFLFTVTKAAVNGLQTDPLFAADVAPGGSTDEDIMFSKDLFEYGITEFTDIEMAFGVYDYDDLGVYDYDDLGADGAFEGGAHIYPLGEDKVTTFVREMKDTDTVVVDNEDITVIVTGYDPEGFWGYEAKMYLVNKTDKELMFSADETLVNGIEIDPLLIKAVGSNKSIFTEATWNSSDFESNGITEVNDISMKLRVYDANDWSAAPVYEDVINLKP